MFVIKAANPVFTGVRCELYFHNGIAQTDDEKIVLELASRGYAVEGDQKPAPKGKKAQASE